MTDNPDYRLYLGKCIKDLEDAMSDLKEDRKDFHDKIDKLIESNITQLSELRLIKEQTTKSNGRISTLENQASHRQVVIDDFRHLETEFKTVKEKVEQIDKDLLEVWFFKKYPRVLIGILTVAIITALILVRTKVATMNETVRILDQKVDLINVPMRTRGGEVVLIPSGVYLDSLNMDTIKK